MALYDPFGVEVPLNCDVIIIITTPLGAKDISDAFTDITGVILLSPVTRDEVANLDNCVYWWYLYVYTEFFYPAPVVRLAFELQESWERQ